MQCSAQQQSGALSAAVWCSAQQQCSDPENSSGPESSSGPKSSSAVLSNTFPDSSSIVFSQQQQCSVPPVAAECSIPNSSCSALNSSSSDNSNASVVIPTAVRFLFSSASLLRTAAVLHLIVIPMTVVFLSSGAVAERSTAIVLL